MEAGDDLLNNINVISRDREPSIYNGLHTSYDSKQIFSKGCIESLYDPYRNNKKENIEHNICRLFPYHNSMTL